MRPLLPIPLLLLLSLPEAAVAADGGDDERQALVQSGFSPEQAARIIVARERVVLEVLERYQASLAADGHERWVNMMSQLPLGEQPAMATIRRLMEDPNPVIRGSAIQWLSRRFPAAVAGDLLELLVLEIEQDTDYAGYAAAEALAGTDGLDAGIASRIARSLARTNLSIRMRAAALRAIGQVGSSEAMVLQVVRLATAHSDADVAYAAHEAIARLLPGGDGDDQDRPSALRGAFAFVALQRAAAELPPAALADLLAPLIGDAAIPTAVKARALEISRERLLSNAAMAAAALASIGGSHPRLESAATAYVASIPAADRPVAQVLAMAGAGDQPDRAVVALGALTRCGPGGAFAIRAVTERLGKLAGPLHVEHIGAILDYLRSHGAVASSAMPVVAALLREDAGAHRDLSKHVAEFVRAFAAATLAEIGAPAQAMPHLIDMVAHGEMALTVAAACRAIPLLPERERALAASYLLRPLKDDFSDAPVNLSAFAIMPSENPAVNTGARIEAIRALAAIGGDALSAAKPLLERRAADPDDDMQRMAVRYQDLAADALKSVP